MCWSPRVSLAEQLGVADAAEAGADSARDAVIQHRRLELLVAAGGLACCPEIEGRHWCRHGHQQATALLPLFAGANPAPLEAMQIYAHSAAGSWAKGMAAGLASHLGIVAGAGAAYPAHGAGHQHR